MTWHVSPAPISSPVHSQTFQMWFESVGRFAGHATKSNFTKMPDGNNLNYVINGAAVLVNYTGKGGFIAKLPVAAKYRAILPVSDNTTIIIEVGDKQVKIPEYATEVTVHGSYICA